MGLFRRGGDDQRSISYQDVWGRGGDWKSSNQKYTGLDALKISTVVACVRRRSSLLSQLPFEAYRNDADGFAVPMPRQPVLIENPSAHVSRSAWIAQMSVSRDLWGNAFGWISSRDGGGYPTAVDWLNPDNVMAYTESGVSMAVRFRVNGAEVPPDSIMMIPSLLLPGSPIGIPPLQYSGLIDLGNMAQKFGSDWFRNGAVPSSILYSDRVLDEDEAQRIRDVTVKSWRNRTPAVLGSGLRLESVKVDSAGTSEGFLDTSRQVQAEICQVFGVPVQAFGISTGGTSLTYANLEQQTQSELVTGLNSDIVALQEHLTAALPRPQFVKANPAALLRSDVKTSYETLAIGIAAKFLTIDEARAKLDMPPMPEATPVDSTPADHMPTEPNDPNPPPMADNTADTTKGP
jgi:HK97 family phage portal protein